MIYNIDFKSYKRVAHPLQTISADVEPGMILTLNQFNQNPDDIKFTAYRVAVTKPLFRTKGKLAIKIIFLNGEVTGERTIYLDAFSVIPDQNARYDNFSWLTDSASFISLEEIEMIIKVQEVPMLDLPDIDSMFNYTGPLPFPYKDKSFIVKDHFSPEQGISVVVSVINPHTNREFIEQTYPTEFFSSNFTKIIEETTETESES